MKVFASLSCVLSAASVAVAAPIPAFGFGGTGTTSNDIKDGKCAPVTFIFARGSTEPGNMGMSVGPGVAKALKSLLGDVAVQGVTYTATMGSNMSGGGPGGKVMAADVKEAKQKCPNTKIAVGGYSQGGMVVHRALASVGSDVSAAILYGDPFQKLPISGTPSKKFCASGDGVCKIGGFAITPGHMSYMTNGDEKEGAQFIVQNTKGGSGGKGSSSSSSSGDSGDSDSSSKGGLAGLMGGGSDSDDSSADADSSDAGADSSDSSDSSSGGGFSLLGGGSDPDDSSTDASDASSADDSSSSSADDSSADASDADESSSKSGGLAGLMGTASKLGKLMKTGKAISGLLGGGKSDE